MKTLAAAFVLAAGAVASAQNVQDQFERNYGFEWGIGNQNGGKAKAWEGGDLRATTVEQGNKRQPGPAKLADVRMTLVSWEPVLLEWLRGALNNESPSRDINFVMLKRDGGPSNSTLYQGSKITELVLSKLDGDEVDVEALVDVSFAPASVQALSQPAVIAGPVSVGVGKETRKKAYTNQFTLAVDGLDASHVVRISAITARFRLGSPPQVSNIVVTMSEHPGAIGGWKTWFDSFVVQGNNADAQEKNGTLHLKSGADPLLSIGLKGLGIVRMTRRPLGAEGNAGVVLQHEVELTCEGLTVQPAGGSAPQLPTGKLPVLPASKTPRPASTPLATDRPASAEGSAEDKGARDPEGAPRFPGCVRTLFSASRTATSSEEYADYVTPSAPDKVEAWFVEQMKTAGWKETNRYETGNLKDATYSIDARWEREKQSAKLLLGKKKDGATTIQMRMLKNLK